MKNNLTPDQIAFLQDLTEKMQTQDIRMTQFPLFYVYDKKRAWVPEDIAEETIFVSNDGGGETEEETDEDEHVWRHDSGDWHKWKCAETGEELEDYEAEEKFDIKKVHIRIEKEPMIDVGPFLTEKAAQAHIDANHYHYHEPFIYVNSCWRNDELQKVLRLLFAVAGKTLPTWYI